MARSKQNVKGSAGERTTKKPAAARAATEKAMSAAGAASVGDTPSGGTSVDELRARLDAAARSAGVPTATSPAATSGPAISLGPIPPPWMMAMPVSPNQLAAGPAPAAQAGSSASAQQAATEGGTPGLGESVKGLLEVAVGLLAAGVAGGRQILGSFAGPSAAWGSWAGHPSSCGCAASAPAGRCSCGGCCSCGPPSCSAEYCGQPYPGCQPGVWSG